MSRISVATVFAGMTTAAGLVVSPTTAAELVPDSSARVFLYANASFCDGSRIPSADGTFCDGTVRPDAVFEYEIDSENGSFSSGRTTTLFVLGDDRIFPAIPDFPGDLAAILAFRVSGNVFPFIEASMSVEDVKGDTSFWMSVHLPVSPISGNSLFDIADSLAVEGGAITASLPSGAFFDHGTVGTDIIRSEGSGVVGAAGATYREEGEYDCGATGCHSIYSLFGFTGPGVGARAGASSYFNLDAAPPAVVPLPAGFALLLSALAGFGLIRRR